jgi:hypothetical protein
VLREFIHSRIALLIHSCIVISTLYTWSKRMSTFHVTVRTAGHPTEYTALAASAAEAGEYAASLFADVPCGITVIAGGR